MRPGATLLRQLRQSSVHLPLGQIAAETGLSPAVVKQQIAELQNAGFELEVHPSLGARLLSSPDRLLADDLSSRLTPEARTLVREMIVLAETGSTNDIATKLGCDGARGGIAILAERQTKGRGRFGRRWESAGSRGIWMSLLLRPTLDLEEWPRLTTWAAVSLVAAIRSTTGLEAGIKWPNDVEFGGRKLAGILAETGSSNGAEPFCVLGVGINLNHEQDDLPEELSLRATSLRLESGRRVDRAEFAARFLHELAVRFDLVGGMAFRELVASARRHSVLLGRAIVAHAGLQQHTGIAEDLDTEGRLVLRKPDGELHTLTAGEVTLRADATVIASPQIASHPTFV